MQAIYPYGLVIALLLTVSALFLVHEHMERKLQAARTSIRSLQAECADMLTRLEHEQLDHDTTRQALKYTYKNYADTRQLLQDISEPVEPELFPIDDIPY